MIEGYWYSEHTPQYPMPVPNMLSQDEANTIYALIKQAEKGARVIRFKGWATSRLTKDRTGVGTMEYSKGNWKWPEGFAEHYVRDNRVKPTDEFLKFIGYLK